MPHGHPTYDRLVAAELRAEAGRQHMPATAIAARARLGVGTVRRRLRGEGRIHFDQLDAIARALGLTARVVEDRALDILRDRPDPRRREPVAR